MKYSDRHISDEELDQLFRDAHASEGQEALFVPEFWSEMESMLPAESKKKRGFYWVPLSVAAILVGIILFYPSAPAKIDRFTQSENEKENEIRSRSVETDRYEESNEKTENPVIVENKPAQSYKTQIRTTFRTQKDKNEPVADQQELTAKVHEHEIGSRLVATESNASATDLYVVNEEKKDVLNPPLNAGTDDELDEINLEARYEKVPHDRVEALPKNLSTETNEWYAELGPTLGQSPYLSPNQKRSATGGAVLGGGYIKRIDNAFVSFGLQARMEGFGGLEYRETNFSQNIVRTVSVKQLYSLEVPLKFGYTLKRSEFAICVTPGLQLFLHGKERITQNQVVQRENTFTGKVEHSNSLTMEFGLQYYYNFTPRFSLGTKVNVDILRPFHTDYYLGKSTGIPVNAQIVFRTRFLK